MIPLASLTHINREINWFIAHSLTNFFDDAIRTYILKC